MSPVQWALWESARPAVAYIVLVDVLAGAAIALGLVAIPFDDAMLIPFVALLACSVAYTELSRSIEQIREHSSRAGPHVDLNSVWMFAGVLLLHPALAAVVITTSYTYRWLRVRHHIVYRQTFSAAATILSGHLCYALVAIVGGHTFAHLPRDLLTFGVVAGAAVVFFFVNFALVSGAVALSMENPRLRSVVTSPGDYALEAATIALGILLGWALLDWPVAAVLIAGVTLVLHRNVLIRQLRELSRLDAKTGLLNASAWATAADAELQRNSRLGQPSGVLVIDLDHFKKINDEHGHLAGDEMLRAVATTLTNEVRTYDLVGRFGGEEFVVLLPETSETETVHVAERIRRRIAELRVPVGTNGTSFEFQGLTVSIGIAVSPRHGSDRSGVLDAADKAMYAAKAAGRNRVHQAAN